MTRVRSCRWATSVIAAGVAIASLGAGHDVAARSTDADGRRDDIAARIHSAADTAGDGLATVEILLDGPGSVGIVGASVRQLGGSVTGSVPGQLLQADIPPEALDPLRRAPGVAFVRPPLAQHLANNAAPSTATTLRDHLAHTNAAEWHAAGHTGSGVKIGIVDGFRGASWDLAAAAGELPPRPDSAHTFCVLEGEPCDVWTLGVAHGVAVAQLVHEVAPGAELYLATASTAADLQAAVEWFVAHGVTVVNRSLGAPLDGPGDGTGPFAAVADYAVSHGIAWFNSTGNEAGRAGERGSYYRAPFTDTDGDGWHEFIDPAAPPGALAAAGEPAPEYLALTCDGQPLLSSLRWNDFADLATATDYDLYVFAQPGEYDDHPLDAHPGIVTAGTAAQGEGGAPPLEHLQGPTCPWGATRYLSIKRHTPGGAPDDDGTAGDVLEIMAEADLAVWSNPYSANYPIADSANPGVFAIGSVGPTHHIEPYSSEGPTNDGRVKPDFTTRSDVATHAMPRFRGTSASSPIAAGLAALVASAGHVDSPAELRTWLLAHAARERGTCGPDTVYGYGELVLPDPVDLQASTEPCVDGATQFVPLPPGRIFDSRAGTSAPGPKGKLPAEGHVDVQVAGAPGIGTDAVAVVLNVTVTEPDAAGYVTAFPSGTARPTASAINVTQPGQTRAALVTVPVGADGRVTLFSKMPAHVIADVAGYYVAVDAPVAAGRFVALTPARVLDTRVADAAGGPARPLGPGARADIVVGGRAGVPAQGVTAVAVNVTVTEAAGPGYLTAFPYGRPRPGASTVNADRAGATAANLAIVPLGPDGRISLFASHGAHAIVDVVGYITDASAPPDTEGLFVPLAPRRLLDTRPEQRASGPKGAVPPDGSIAVATAGVVGVPPEATAVVLSVAAVDAAPGFVTLWDDGPRPLASILNVEESPTDTRANGAVLPIGPDGHVRAYMKSGGHLVADVTGYFLW